MLQKGLQHLQVHRRVPDHAFFSDLFPARLELGLHQAHGLSLRGQQSVQRRQDQPQGDKRHVHRRKVQLLWDLLMGKIAGVGAFHAHHPRVSPELPVQLAVAHIHSVDLCGPVLQHAVREAAGGCADIGADLAVHGQGKRLHGLLQLQTAPADIGQSMAPHLDGGGIGHRRAGLVHPLTVNKHTAGHDNGLGLLAAFQQALLH